MALKVNEFCFFYCREPMYEKLYFAENKVKVHGLVE